MDLKKLIIKDKLPRHIAIIMDGNGRWAQSRGNMRVFGHQNGVESVKQVVEASGELGIEYLTLYAFSTENWNRPRAEVDALMGLMVKTIEAQTESLHENNVRLTAIGELDDLPPAVKKQLQNAMDYTSGNTGLNLVLALSYSGRWEITSALKTIIEEIQKGNVDPGTIDTCLIETYLNTSNIPDPELLIRTSGERRISNFMLWQLAYTELYFSQVLWPDFRKKDFYEAIIDFQRRDRRFGRIKEQLGTETVKYQG
ncbi:MAG: isoprenyl transferase [Bacteroidales bacterium]|nr:isoprenyl transferase [Bacteroidales bacterium]